MMFISRIILSLWLIYAPALVLAHPGGKDSYGCHTNKTLAVYECHTGKFAGRQFSDKAAMLKALAGLQPPLPAQVIALEGAKLTWDAATDGQTTGYWLYWGVKPGVYQEPQALPLVSSLDLPPLLKGATYYFALKAFNIKGETSSFSNEAVKEVR